MDFGTLCDLADRLTGVFILTRAYQTTRSVHAVTVPRSWVVELWAESYRYKENNAAHPARLVDILLRLLADVHAGESLPLHESNENSSLHVDAVYQRNKAYLELPREAARDVCMSRMCVVALRHYCVY